MSHWEGKLKTSSSCSLNVWAGTAAGGFAEIFRKDESVTEFIQEQICYRWYRRAGFVVGRISSICTRPEERSGQGEEEGRQTAIREEGSCAMFCKIEWDGPNLHGFHKRHPKGVWGSNLDLKVSVQKPLTRDYGRAYLEIDWCQNCLDWGYLGARQDVSQTKDPQSVERRPLVSS